MSTSQDFEYAVVKHDTQYSLWPAHQPLPPGFSHTGLTGTRAEMEGRLAQQFVETTPANYHQHTGFSDTA
jgi:uncharacterized protein YbdZ (MbtH family)